MCDEVQFNLVLNIWITKPQTINKWIYAARIISTDNNCTERVIYPKLHTNVKNFNEKVFILPTFLNFVSDHFNYKILLENGSILVHYDKDTCPIFMSFEWIQTCFVPKLNLWYNSKLHSVPPSLDLIDPGYYQSQYKMIKDKYSSKLIENWKEKTDPYKFVHEDIGIACYLKCLWVSDSNIKFVDVGCGNGLLTYILLSEGYEGFGIDLRKRKIWDLYPANVRNNLKELILDPEQPNNEFFDATWLIGNHSDELTPWIPIWAAKSNLNCNVFLLPCCPFGLFGKFNYQSMDSKNKRSNDSNYLNPISHSRFKKYLKYLKDLFELCGFIPEIDTLRIPSTKSICIVGRIRKHFTLNNNLSDLINDFIESERVSTTNGNRKFIARKPIEPVLNCTKIPGAILQSICMLIFNKLLLIGPNLDDLDCGGLIISESFQIQSSDNRWWNPGGILNFKQINRLLSDDQRRFLKSQNGGLQTLIKNHRQYFQISKCGVRLRLDSSKLIHSLTTNKPPPNLKRKTKLCLMIQYHPDGCPYSTELCDYAHSSNELPN